MWAVYDSDGALRRLFHAEQLARLYVWRRPGWRVTFLE